MGRTRRRKPDGKATEPNPQKPDASRGFDWREHAGATVGLLSLGAIAGRLLIVSDFSAETARAIIQETGAVNVGLGAVLELLPFVSAFAWGVGIVMQLDSYQKQSTSPVRWVVLALVSMVGAGLAPIAYVVCFLVLALLIWQWGQAAEFLSERWQLLQGPVMALIATAIAFMLTYGIGSRALWLPAERLEIRGEPALVGYVLSEEDGRVTILRDQPRTVLRVDEDQVRKREICTIEQDRSDWLDHLAWAEYPLARLVVVGTDRLYPICP
ncbi:MAG TPA: hypothetical protein VI076_02340 [Actinopolymorphaceae bacterium]